MNPNPTTPTPETDAKTFNVKKGFDFYLEAHLDGTGDYVTAEFARKLERARDELERERDLIAVKLRTWTAI